MTSAEIKPYDITCGEKVHYGYYTALEVVFNQFLNELESYFFDEFNISLDFNYSINTGLKFKQFLDRLDSPKPIFLFNLSPLVGDCLLVMENRSANLLLSRNQLHESKKTLINNRFVLSNNHSIEIQQVIEQLLSIFCNCWNKILPVNSKLKKLVSNKIKARVMSPVEACVMVRLNLSQNLFSTYWDFCFSDYQLDQVIKRYGSKLLLAGNGEARENEATRHHFKDLLLNESSYMVSGILGKLNISEEELMESFKNQTVIPIRSDISDNVIVTVNEKPLLSASVGLTNGQIALRINGKYDSKKVEKKEKQKSFAKMRFPDA